MLTYTSNHFGVSPDGRYTRQINKHVSFLKAFVAKLIFVCSQQS